MYEPTRRWLLRLLKVPPEPDAPWGDPASVRVFRAGRNYFRLQLAGWALAQVLALAGIIFWAAVLIEVEGSMKARRETKPSPPPPAAGTAAAPAAPKGQEFGRSVVALANSFKEKAANPAARKRSWGDQWTQFKQVLAELGLMLPAWTFPLIWALKLTGFSLYLVQIPLTYAIRRMNYEMHWYVVTDRSLRLRTGVWNVQELTMSFANLQQVVVTQGPVQRLLGLADVRVQSAGGGHFGGEQAKGGNLDTMHTGFFHSVDNASEIRDLILERLRRFRESGLGDPEERRRPAPAATPPAAAAPAELLAAARELRDEARALRTALG